MKFGFRGLIGRSNSVIWSCIWVAGICFAVASPALGQSLAEALNAPGLVWSTGGVSDWTVESDISRDGLAVDSGTLDGPNWIETTIMGPTAVNFSWKVSSWKNIGILSLSIGDKFQTSISGEVDWQSRSFLVPAGSNTVRWLYAQDHASDTAQNRGWLDQISVADPVPVSIVNQPVGKTTIVSNSVSLEVTAAGTEPFSFQWQKNGINMLGQVLPVLVLSNPRLGDSGDYTVVISNAAGVVTSQVATLTVKGLPPVITAQPNSCGSAPGSAAYFSADANGFQPISWQWFSNGVAVVGATSALFSIPRVTNSSYCDYWAVASNPWGSVTSAVTSLSYTPIAGWGYTGGSALNISPAATNVIAVAAGDNHGMALRRDGTAVLWGAVYGYSTGLLPGGSNLTSIAAGSMHCVAVRNNGTVPVWGYIAINVTPSAPKDATNAMAVAVGCGAQHAAYIRTNGTVVDWGYQSPVLVPTNATNVVMISAGAYHTVALRADGTLLSWGDQTSVPENATNVVAIASGWYHNLALRADGTLVQWGRGMYYPGLIPDNATNIVAFACGGNHSLALRSDGKVLAWGENGSGQSTVPTWVTNIVDVAGASSASFAIIGDGPPAVTSVLVDRSIPAGKTAFFRATAVGAWPLSYQWRFQGADLPGETNQVLSIQKAQSSNDGLYSVVVSNAQGVAISRVARLKVFPAQASFFKDSLGFENGQMHFRAADSSNSKWILQGSTNLLNWSDLTPLTTSAGLIDYTNARSSQPNYFFRLKSQ